MTPPPPMMGGALPDIRGDHKGGACRRWGPQQTVFSWAHQHLATTIFPSNISDIMTMPSLMPSQ